MPTGKRIGSLRTIDDIAVEYRRIYRMCRNGQLALPDGKSYCWMLKQLSGLIAESDLEARLERLEDQFSEGPG